jgi:hypothetical protein
MVAAIASASCGAPLMKLPSGPGSPATDVADAFADATAACRAVSSISADIAASGSVGGQRLRGHLLTGLAAPASVRLEAVAPVGQPIFILVAKDGDATLLLPREDRVLEHGLPAAVLEAVAGVRLDPAELRQALTGCVPLEGTPQGRSLGADWRLATLGSTDVYLHRDPKVARWQIVSTIHKPAGGAWRADYRNFQDGLPRAVHLMSVGDKRFDLSLNLSQVALNESLGAEVFRVDVPPGVERITLDQLNHARPGIREN